MKTLIKTSGLVIDMWPGGARLQCKNLGTIFVPARLLDKRFEWRANVAIRCYKDDSSAQPAHEQKVDSKMVRPRSDFIADEILDVRPAPPPPAPVWCYGIVDKHFSSVKGRGYVTLVGPHPFKETQAHLNAKKDFKTLKPERGDRVNVLVQETMGGLVIRELKFSPHITATVNLLQRKPVQAATKAPERLIGTAEGNLAVVGDQALPAVRKKRTKRPESLG